MDVNLAVHDHSYRNDTDFAHSPLTDEVSAPVEDHQPIEGLLGTTRVGLTNGLATLGNPKISTPSCGPISTMPLL